MKYSDVLVILCIASFTSGCSENYYSEADFGKVKKIDTHIHLNGESSSISEQAKEDNFFILTVHVDVPSYPPLAEQQRLALHQISNAPDRIRFLTAFTLQNWQSPSWADETIAGLKSDFAKGAIGIKLWKNIGMVYRDADSSFIMIDNPKFDPVIQYVIGQDKTVMGHLGEPKNCWLPLDEMTVNNDRNYFREHPEYHMYLHPEYPSYEDQINARDRFLARHPDMRFVGAHLGSLEWNVDELAKRLDRFPNMAVDMAARIPHVQHQARLDREKVRNFFIKYQDRLIYATDMGISADSDDTATKKRVHATWSADWKFFVTDDVMTAAAVDGEFRGLKLPREVIDKIFFSNAVRWFRIDGA